MKTLCYGFWVFSEEHNNHDLAKLYSQEKYSKADKIHKTQYAILKILASLFMELFPLFFQPL